MEQFNLDIWLKDRSRKVVTRDGRPVRIVCWDCKNEQPIIALTLEPKIGIEIPRMYSSNGVYHSRIESSCDLFFADEENELNEFEKQLGVYIYYPKLSCEFDEDEKKYIRDAAKTLLDLARKELEENYYTKVLDDRVVFKSGLNATDLQTAYDMGKQDALKDLPKWKKATEYKDFEINEACILDDNIYPIIATNVNIGEYYLELDELKNLPLEK